MPPLLSENNENGVPEVPDLGNVEQPQEVSKRGVLLVVCNAGSYGVTISVSKQTSFDCHVCAKHDLGNVVQEFDRVWVDRVHGLHDLRPNEYKQNVYQSDGKGGGKVGQRPSLQISKRNNIFISCFDAHEREKVMDSVENDEFFTFVKPVKSPLGSAKAIIASPTEFKVST